MAVLRTSNKKYGALTFVSTCACACVGARISVCACVWREAGRKRKKYNYKKALKTAIAVKLKRHDVPITTESHTCVPPADAVCSHCVAQLHESFYREKHTSDSNVKSPPQEKRGAPFANLDE